MNGHYKGITPLNGNMEVGQYEVDVKLEGYTAPMKAMKVQDTTPSSAKFHHAKSPRSKMPA
jgi:hypothetical protein